MAALFCRLLLVVSALFHQPAEPTPGANQNRVLIAYNSAYDTCRGADESIGVTAKTAADKACEQAFEALDQLKKNSCFGWRHAECRLIDGDRQCSCKISNCDDCAVRNNIIRPFRDCAAYLWTDELRTLVTPAPSIQFQQLRSYYDDVWRLAKSRRVYSTYGQQYFASSSRDVFTTFGGSNPAIAYTPYGPDSSSGVYNQYGEGSSTGALNPFTALSSASVYFPGVYESPIAAYPPYASTSQSIPPKPGKGKVAYPYSCPVCPEKFRTLNGLGEHMKIHPIRDRRLPSGGPTIIEPETNRYKCGVCGNTYARQRVLREHEKIHESNATYCIQCDQTFSSKHSLKNHMLRRHPTLAATLSENQPPKGEKPEQCDVCGKRYKNLRSLREHKLAHAGATTCEICGAVYSRVSALYEHRKLVHGL